MLAFSSFLPLSPAGPTHLHRNHGNWRVGVPTCQQAPSQEPQSPSSPSRNSSAMAAAAATFVLKRAATAYTKGTTPRPAARTVQSSLLELEKQQRLNRQKSDISQLYGQWRLVLTADPRGKGPLPKAIYFPIRAHQTFLKGEDGLPDIFDNGIFLPGLTFRLRGPMRWVAKANRLEFTVDEAVLKLGNWQVWKGVGLDKEGSSLEGRTSRTLPFFSFFSVRSDIASARGRKGGLALYARVPSEEQV